MTRRSAQPVYLDAEKLRQGKSVRAFVETKEGVFVTNSALLRDAHLSVRVPAALKEALQHLAAAEHRKLADYVHHALQQHVETVIRKRKPAGTQA